jgi:hypothetical protein
MRHCCGLKVANESLNMLKERSNILRVKITIKKRDELLDVSSSKKSAIQF